VTCSKYMLFQVKVKPNNSEVELVLRMDVESENYDIDAPEPLRLRKQVKAQVTYITLYGASFKHHSSFLYSLFFFSCYFNLKKNISYLHVLFQYINFCGEG